jgi:hypothetical protein
MRFDNVIAAAGYHGVLAYVSTLFYRFYYVVPAPALEQVRDIPNGHDPSGRGGTLPVGRPSRGAALHRACRGSPNRGAKIPEAIASDTKVRREDGA